MTPQQLQELRQSPTEVRLLDVRTPGEFETVHVEGAYNVPLDTLKEHASEFTRSQAPVVILCQSGNRARQAEEALHRAGRGNLFVLEGGMKAWLEAGFPVRRGRQRLSLERQVRIAAGFLVALFSVLALTVNVWLAAVPAFVGAGLVFAGVTDTCGMAMLLARLPYNRPAGCDIQGALARCCS